MKQLRHKIFEILEVSKDKKGWSWYFDIALTTLIALNILALVLESVPSLHAKYESFFFYFELVSVIIFSIEYVLRIWVAVENETFRKPFRGRLRYAFTPLAVIDLLAILPFYLAFFPIDLRFLRILRLFRLFRLFKVMRYVLAMEVIHEVFGEKKDQLLVSIVFILFMLLVVSCTMYYVESGANTKGFSSIPETMWWGVATLTTVGYGDVYPATGLGKFLGGTIAMLGIGLFALPTGILASGFSDALDKKKAESNPKNFCSNCGYDLNS